MGEPPMIMLEPWDDSDAALLARLNAPEMTEHLGGPESPEQLERRQHRYVNDADPARSQMLRVVLAATGERVGSVGYWEREWQGETVYEMGWGILPEYQGRGIAVAAAAAAIDRARAQHRHARIHAYPSRDNPASNAVCRRLGFTLAGPCDVEYPPGHQMLCNDWWFPLVESQAEVSARVGALMADFFAAVSFGPGGRPAYERVTALFRPEGLLIRGGPGPAEVMTTAAFVRSRQAALATGALTEFAETERSAVTDVFGSVAQRRSVYDKRGVRDGVAFEAVGVIVTQFVHDLGGWRISAMAWDDERPGLSRPDVRG